MHTPHPHPQSDRSEPAFRVRRDRSVARCRWLAQGSWQALCAHVPSRRDCHARGAIATWLDTKDIGVILEPLKQLLSTFRRLLAAPDNQLRHPWDFEGAGELKLCVCAVQELQPLGLAVVIAIPTRSRDVAHVVSAGVSVFGNYRQFAGYGARTRRRAQQVTGLPLPPAG
jgi:hypothetical protein